MDFALFIILNTVLFIRPSELVPELAAVPIYQIVIISCLAVTLPRVIEQIRPESLARRPITLFVVGIWLAVVLSIVFGMFWLTGAKDAGMEFGKVVLYYLLMMAVVNTLPRLRQFMVALCVLTAMVCGLAVADLHGIVDIAGISPIETGYFNRATSEIVSIPRIRATGIFQDPNDLAMLTVLGMACAVYGASLPTWRAHLPMLLSAIALFLYTLALTHSRGGFLAFLIAGVVLFQSRFGWKRAVPLLAVALPLAVLLFGGRQTSFGDGLSEGTGQQRIQIWSEGLQMLRTKPLFGIGRGQFVEEVRHVAHNSYVQAYAEMGLFGGTLFLAAFSYPLWLLYRLGDKHRQALLSPALSRLRPFLLAAFAGYAGAMLTLSRTYIVPTYLVVGLSAVYLRLVQAQAPLPELRLSRRMVRQLATASVLFVAGTYVFVRAFARWSG
jgi:O-antigen ligase